MKMMLRRSAACRLPRLHRRLAAPVARWQSTASTASTPAPAPQPPSVLVLGGNGFVGSAVCAAAVGAGMRVSSLSRSGRPGWYEKLAEGEREDHWASQVEWKSGDVFEPASLTAAMAGDDDAPVDAVVSTIGAFGNTEFMLKMCGQATIGAVEVAKEIGVPRFVFISAHDYGFPVRNLVAGYYDGKQNAEAAIADTYGESGVVLRASAVYGKRTLPGKDGATLPLDVRLSPSATPRRCQRRSSCVHSAVV
jgi:nucleoside-diphosphate-sugar epimerase